MKHKKLITVISSVIILLPIAFGLIVWDKLPQTITTHWGADGTANGWQSRLAVVLQPLFFKNIFYNSIKYCNTKHY